VFCNIRSTNRDNRQADSDAPVRSASPQEAEKDAPKRAQAARELAKKVGVEIKEVYLTSGDDDLLVIVDTPNGDDTAGSAGAPVARCRNCRRGSFMASP
jgi:DNA-binding Lrp family transcriptional regulator